MTAIQLLIFHEKYLKQFVWVIPEKSTESDESSIRFTVASDSSPGSDQPVKSAWVKDSTQQIFIFKSGKRTIFRISDFCFRFHMHSYWKLLADIWRYLQKYKKYLEFCCLFVELHYFKLILVLGFFVSLTKVRSYKASELEKKCNVHLKTQ